MKIRSSKTFYFLLFTLVALLTSCGRVPSIQPFTPTAVPLHETATPNSETGIIEPENVHKLQILEKWGKGNIYGVALSPDEASIAVSTVKGVYFYDAKSLQQKQFINLPITLDSGKYDTLSKSISFRPDGNFLALGRGNSILVWNLLENKFDRAIYHQVYGYDIVQIAYSPQGKTMAVVSIGTYFPCDATGGNFALYDVESGKLLYNDFFCPEASLYHFAFLSNGNAFFVGRNTSSRIYQASIVDGNTGVLVKNFSHENYIDSISPDGSKISVRDYSDHTEIIDIDTQKSIGKMDGMVIFLPGSENQLVATKNSWKIITNDHKPICDFASQPDLILRVFKPTYTLVGNKLIFWDVWFPDNVEVWDMTRCKLLNRLNFPLPSESLIYSKDGNLLAAHSMRNIHIFNGENGNFKFSIPGYYGRSPVQYYDFSTNSKMLVVVSDSDPYKITFWDTTSGKQLQSIQTEFEYFRHVAFVSGDTMVATADKQGLHFWDIKSQKLINTLPIRSDISFNTEKDYFALRDDDSILFRSIENGSIKNKISIAEKNFRFTFSKDWTYLAVKKEKIELWDIDGHKLREFVEYPPIDPTIQSSSTYDFQFSPSNHVLIAMHLEDGSYKIRFWDTRTGAILREIPLPFSRSIMEFSPDGKKLAVLGNGIIYVFGINPSQ